MILNQEYVHVYQNIADQIVKHSQELALRDVAHALDILTAQNASIMQYLLITKVATTPSHLLQLMFSINNVYVLITLEDMTVASTLVNASLLVYNALVVVLINVQNADHMPIEPMVDAFVSMNGVGRSNVMHISVLAQLHVRMKMVVLGQASETAKNAL